MIQNRRRSTQVPAVLRKSVRFSKLKSSQYPVLMTQKPRRVKIQTISWRGTPPDPKEACTFTARLKNQSVLILDPPTEANKVPVRLFVPVFLAVIISTYLWIWMNHLCGIPVYKFDLVVLFSRSFYTFYSVHEAVKTYTHKLSTCHNYSIKLCHSILTWF